MPYLTVSTPATDGPDVVVYREDLTPVHMETEHASRQLLERLRWAIDDAQEVERTTPRPAV
jgi:hypothetical protein